MKNKIFVFIAGVIVGVLMTMLILSPRSSSNSSEDSDLRMFEKPRATLDVEEMKVFQVFTTGEALAMTSYPNSMVVLLLSEDGESYYDEQKIQVPSGACVRQVGIYRYVTKDERIKTVPVVKIQRNK